ncbi:hypothetical protein, partial [Pseudomonas aeruginosa]|uniref:hypothetical protein n=1 Tax=Pseudomonas aeruginosa TaxID=287 RepID=UPI001CA4F2A7
SLFVPFTIVRTVGILSVAVDNDPILNQSYTAAFGAAVVQKELGTTAPDPFTDASDDIWFWHQFAADRLESGGGGDQIMSRTYVIDSKAQRKVVDGQQIVFQGEGGGDSDGFDAALFVRILCKLH